MKKIDLSNISTNLGMPIKSGVLSHLQSAYQEVIDAIVKGNIGGVYDATKFYVLYGCVNSTIAPIYTVSAGAIFFNGEIYLVDAFTFTASDTAVGTITTSFFSGANADPITFTDSVARNVLQIRKIVFADATSGSGDVDFGDLFFQNTDKFFVGTTGNPSFQNTWANYTSITDLFFQRINNNLIISGKLQGGTYADSASIIFTLPEGFRPSRNVLFSASASYYNTKWYRSSCLIGISPSGLVSVSVDNDFLTAAKAVSSIEPYIDIYSNISLQ